MIVERGIEVVIGDVHARADLLGALLLAVGAVDARARRRRGFRVIQVGDLLDRRVSPEENVRVAELALRTVDVVLAGNHEMQLLTERDALQGCALQALATRGWPRPAAEAGGWLVTHAGVHPELTDDLPGDARECAAEINDRWRRHSLAQEGDPLFDWVGPARGGRSPCGGVFWSALSEWPQNARTPWGQICGHVPQARPRLLPGPRWLIDLGAERLRLAALVRANGGPWRPVTVALADDHTSLAEVSAAAA